MPIGRAETYSLGGVDSRSNPANFPPERALRCLNFSPLETGALRLRSGYTVPMNATNDTVGGIPIHSLLYYEQFSASYLGPQFCMYGKGSSILTFNETTKVSTVIGSMPSGNPWGHFRSKNRIHFGEGSAIPFYGYNFGFQNWDGTTLRPSGIPTLATPGTVNTISANTAGSFAPSTLGGYQFYEAWYNPITQHMGNCTQVGARVNVSATGSQVVLGGMGTPPSPEWVTAVGMTNDGGQVPYWLVDANGNHIVIGNTATQGTILIGNVDPLAELPFRNYVPPPFDKFARVQTKIFANKSGSPFLYYSNDESDVTNANYVGNPEESWPADQAEPFPTGELPTSIHGIRFEGWFFSRNHLAIWSLVLLQQGSNPWRGPWEGGCAGQRLFVNTPYGPYWVTPHKQIATFMDDGVISISEEYEAALLGRLGDSTLSQAELAYVRDPETRTDVLVLKGLDKNGNLMIVIHDFLIKDNRSPFGQGYEYSYVNMTLQTFCGAGYTPRTNAVDVGGTERLWAGSKEGMIAQIEDDSNSDNGAEYSGDYIGLIGLGPNRPSIAELEFQGDANLHVSYLTDESLSLGDFKDAIPPEIIPGASTRYGAKYSGEEARWLYQRLQLTSHHQDGNFLMPNPPYIPMPTYGVINMAILKLGAERPEGR